MCAAIKTSRLFMSASNATPTAIATITLLALAWTFGVMDSASATPAYQPTETKYPCAFIDTVNVTGSNNAAYEQQLNAAAAGANRNGSSSSGSDGDAGGSGVHSSNNTVSLVNITMADNTNNNNNNRTNSSGSSSGSSINISSNSDIAAPPTPTFYYNQQPIPPELVAVYDFVIRNGVRVSVERHLRACVCKLKPCIRFCCAEGHYYNLEQRNCEPIIDTMSTTIASSSTDSASDSNSAGNDATDSAITVDTTVESVSLAPSANPFALTGIDHREVAVRQSNGSTRLVATAQHFNMHIGVPCERMRFITKDNQLVHWTLYENGTIAHRNHLFSKHYCYTPLQLDNTTWEWQPLACAPEKFPFVLSTKEWTYAICLIIAVICMVIILFVYLICSDLRNTFYGVAIKAYSLCIIIGYSLMAHLTLTDPTDLSRLACTNMPCYVLLYIMLSFYILSFISFNFYMNFHGIILSRLMFWLIFFPIVLLAVGWSIFVAHDNYDGKAVLGGDTCWFDPRNWSIMIYFYAPIFIACVLSIFFYIITLIHISERHDFNIRKPSETFEENRFKSFWKFFMYTFAVWLVCISSFAINYYRNERTHINYAVCLFVAFHGFGALYALIGKNQQVQNFLRRIDEDVVSTYSEEDEMTESAVPMSGF